MGFFILWGVGFRVYGLEGLSQSCKFAYCCGALSRIAMEVPGLEPLGNFDSSASPSREVLTMNLLTALVCLLGVKNGVGRHHAMLFVYNFGVRGGG